MLIAEAGPRDGARCAHAKLCIDRVPRREEAACTRVNNSVSDRLVENRGEEGEAECAHLAEGGDKKVDGDGGRAGVAPTATAPPPLIFEGNPGERRGAALS